MNQFQKQLIQELLRRKAVAQEKSKKHSFRVEGFDVQNAYLDDRWKSRFRGLNCTRRSGKSVGNAIDDFEICEQFPGSRIVTGGITLDSITEIIWDIYKELDEQHKLGLKFNETKKIATFPNGSRIRLFGLDSNEKQMRKILGQKLRKASIDEAGSLTVDMQRVCYQMIMPALADLRPHSWLTLLGTCENIPLTFFESVTEGREKFVPWSVHKWTAYENPFMKKQWEDEMHDLITQNPLVTEASWFKTHYLNQWCVDDELQIITLQDHNYFNSLPVEIDSYVLGVDLGFNDDTSFALMGYNRNDPRTFCQIAEKEKGLDFTAVSQRINYYRNNYPIIKIKIDGSNKQGVEEMRVRHKLPLEATEKSPGYKQTVLRLLSDDVKTGRVLLNKGGTIPLQNEWTALQWEDKQREKEDPRCQNHCSDAALYAWLECRNYHAQPPAKPISINSEEWALKQEEEEAERLQMKESGELEWWEEE